MVAARSAQDILEQDFLEIRCLILNLAAALDRIDRAEGADVIGKHEQMQLLQGGLDVLQQAGPGRAEKMQLLFSDQYKEGWNTR